TSIDHLIKTGHDTASLPALREMALHFLGRSLGDKGLEHHRRDDVEHARTLLKEAYRLDQEHALPVQMGYSLLREVPLLDALGKEKTAQWMLDQASDLLSAVPSDHGNVSLQRARLATQRAKIHNLLEDA